MLPGAKACTCTPSISSSHPSVSYQALLFSSYVLTSFACIPTSLGLSCVICHTPMPSDFSSRLHQLPHRLPAKAQVSFTLESALWLPSSAKECSDYECRLWGLLGWVSVSLEGSRQAGVEKTLRVWVRIRNLPSECVLRKKWNLFCYKGFLLTLSHLNLTTTSWGWYCYSYILLLRKYRLREIK